MDSWIDDILDAAVEPVRETGTEWIKTISEKDQARQYRRERRAKRRVRRQLRRRARKIKRARRKEV